MFIAELNKKLTQEKYSLTLEEQAAINEAEVKLEAGKGIPHDVVKEKLKKKFPNIVKWE